MNEAIYSALKTTPPYFAGILNATPDSFSGDGLSDLTHLIKRAHHLIKDGASLIDLGGESSRPNSTAVSAEVETSRIEPVIKELADQCFISVDTYKASVARKALELGAKMINDISAMRSDPEMLPVVRDHGCFIVLMYSKESPAHPLATMQEKHYTDVIAEIAEFIKQRIDYAVSNGISPDKIIVDPGMGRFVSHDPKYSFQILRELRLFKAFGIDAPIMVGASRKGFLGETPATLDKYSAFAGIQAIQNGASFIRTHNIAAIKQLTRANSLLKALSETLPTPGEAN